jgi:hypothetical protein
MKFLLRTLVRATMKMMCQNNLENIDAELQVDGKTSDKIMREMSIDYPMKSISIISSPTWHCFIRCNSLSFNSFNNMISITSVLARVNYLWNMCIMRHRNHKVPALERKIVRLNVILQATYTCSLLTKNQMYVLKVQHVACYAR